jgi:glycogen debranching enzyme
LRLDAARDDQPVMVIGDDGTTATRLRNGDRAGTFDLPSPTDAAPAVLTASGWELRDDRIEIDIELAAGATWESTITVTAPGGRGEGAVAPELVIASAPERLAGMARDAADDLAALSFPLDGRLVLAAGSPHFLALFGRDSMIAGIQALISTPQRLADILAVLADHQATAVDAGTRAQPGRIVHELRLGRAGVFGVPPGTPYYGAADTAALFVAALGEAWRWGADDAAVAALVPPARAALEWCEHWGDIDGDGFVESVPDPDGLTNLGWKDSGDSIVRADGSTYVGVNALPEVQAYGYRAARDLATLERHLGLDDGAERIAKAARLATRFAESFLYTDEHGNYVGLALVPPERGGAKQLLAVRASNAGHVLWSGILPPTVAGGVARHLVAGDLFSGWGVRTLSRDAAGYNPFGYHRGTVWPHDTGFALHGAARYGADDVVRTLAGGLVDLGTALGGQLPELLAGIDRGELPLPVPYPAACRPQAWASGSMLTVVRALLGLEPDVPAGVVRVHPALPDGWRVELRGVRLGRHELSLVAEGDTVVDADAPGLDVITGADAVLANTDWCPAFSAS